MRKTAVALVIFESGKWHRRYHDERDAFEMPSVTLPPAGQSSEFKMCRTAESARARNITWLFRASLLWPFEPCTRPWARESTVKSLPLVCQGRHKRQGSNTRVQRTHGSSCILQAKHVK